MNPWSSPIFAIERLGEIEQFIGLKMIANGPPQAFIGEVCDILDNNQRLIMQAEVVGFNQGSVYLMPYDMAPIRMGYQVRATGKSLAIKVGAELIGQVVDAFAQSIDPSIPLFCREHIGTQNKQINPLTRVPIEKRLSTGIHAIDGLLPLGRGQRIGLFAGSGVGKSMLLANITKTIDSDVNVIALIGERGREVKDFITNHLSEESRKKTVLVVACSDESALKRRQAVYTATAIAEYFCQQGKEVLLCMDSITRFAMAQREISLSLGEPPTARGYTPSVFSLLPGVIERTGNFKNQGSISAIYTVLVEGDDFNEPLADHMRSLLDGHIILTRELAQQGHYPAISILQSVSRLATNLFSKAEYEVVKQVISTLSLYQQNKELIELGAYKSGSNPLLDKAIICVEAINRLLVQEHSLVTEELIGRFQEILQ